MNTLERWLARLAVRCLPRGFSSRYGPEILEYWQLRGREIRAEQGQLAVLWFWCRGGTDLIRAAIGERRDDRRVRLAMTKRRGDGIGAAARDVRFTVRSLRRNPGFAATTIVTIGLGIGANTAIFSVLYGVVLRPLPFADPAGLVYLQQTQRSDGSTNPASLPNFVDWYEQSRVFAGLAAVDDGTFVLSGSASAERMHGAAVTHRFFDVFRAAPVLGRGFVSRDEGPAAVRTVVLGYAVWSRVFGADSSLLGTSIVLNGEPRVVVGIAPEGFGFPSGADIYVPIAVGSADSCGRDCLRYEVVARLGPGVSLERAREEMDVIASRLESAYPEDNTGMGVSVRSLHDVLVGDVRQPLWLLLGAVAFVLLIACGNVANLVVARGSSRRKEVTLRAALGASRGRIIRQLLTESVVLGIAGGVAGMGLAILGVEMLRQLAADSLPRVDAVGVNIPVLLFAAGASIVTGMMFGLVPALHTSRSDAESLKVGGRTGGIPHHTIARDALAVGQVAMSLTLLVGAGLTIKSFVRLMDVDPGFDTEALMTARVALPGDRYAKGAARHVFFDELIERLRSSPGAEAVAASLVQPINDGDLVSSFHIDGRPYQPRGSSFTASVRSITPTYFETVRMPVLSGRNFAASDDSDATSTVIVSEALAQRHWPNESPIGRRMTLGLALTGDNGTPPLREIVGVVGNVKIRGLDDRERAVVYLPYAQNPFNSMTVLVRASRDPLAIAATIRAVVSDMDPDLAVYSVSTMDDIIASSVASPRFYMLLLGIFAAVAVAMAAVGILGVISYGVNQRTKEMGIRMALGAESGRLVRSVVARGALLAVAGVAIGLGLSVWTAGLIRGLLFEVEPVDPTVMAVVTAMLVSTALLASYLPARRAGRVDPVTTLRAE